MADRTGSPVISVLEADPQVYLDLEVRVAQTTSWMVECRFQHDICIQDSEEDKVKECAQMDQIYSQSYITISAANGDNCHQ